MATGSTPGRPLADDETMSELQSWHVRARNLPEHARNPIHTDAGGRAAGFRGALVAGVTVYAYLTRPAVDAWGLEWIESGIAEVRFRSPVLDDDALTARPGPVADDGRVPIEAVVDGEVRAVAVVGRGGADPGDEAAPKGEPLDRLVVDLTGEWADYGLRAGEDAHLYAERDLVHVAVWPALANAVVHAQLARGSWIHTRSRIRHRSSAAVGGVATVEATVIDRFDTRSGERALLDVRISVDGSPVAHLEHEALVALAR